MSVWQKLKKRFGSPPVPAEIKPTEIKPAEIKPPEIKPAEIKPAEIKLAEIKSNVSPAVGVRALPEEHSPTIDDEYAIANAHLDQLSVPRIRPPDTASERDKLQFILDAYMSPAVKNSYVWQAMRATPNAKNIAFLRSFAEHGAAIQKRLSVRAFAEVISPLGPAILGPVSYFQGACRFFRISKCGKSAGTTKSDRNSGK